jgi:hypothetical protein
MRKAIFLSALSLSIGVSQAQDSPVKLSAWHEAVKKGDVAEVRRLLAQGADVNAAFSATPDTSVPPTSPFRKGATALHIAAAQGSLELIELLLKAKSHLAVRDEYGWLALQAFHLGKSYRVRLPFNISPYGRNSGNVNNGNSFQRSSSVAIGCCLKLLRVALMAPKAHSFSRR